jgi:hypothetical protein
MMWWQRRTAIRLPHWFLHADARGQSRRRSSGQANRIKHCRRVTHYDTLAANYLAFVQPASIRLRLRVTDFTLWWDHVGTFSGAASSPLFDFLLNVSGKREQSLIDRGRHLAHEFDHLAPIVENPRLPNELVA